MVFLFVPPGLYAAETNSFPERQVVDGHELTMRGSGILRYMVFIKVYEGAFYLSEGDPVERALDGSAARRLVFHYFHGIAAGDLVASTTEMIRRNVSPEAFTTLRPKIDQFNNMYLDVETGDRYTATFIPGTGTRLALNDRELGTVDGADFAAAFFAIWLGENPIDKTFRDRLLGKRR